MEVSIILYKAEEGGFWAEVPAIPGCATQGDTVEELHDNLRDAIRGCLSARAEVSDESGNGRILVLGM